MPKISVVMSIYNGEAHLREAVESILNQSFRDFEFITIDDASADGTPAILAEYAKKDGRLRVIRNEANLGLTKSLNKGIRMSAGVYIARMDADDVSYPDRFKLQTAYLDTHPSCGVVGTWGVEIDENGKMLRTVRFPATGAELKKTLIKYNPFFHSSIMLRKKALDDVGLYDESWQCAQDYELYFRIVKRYELANLPLILTAQRRTSQSVTSKKNRRQTLFAIKARIKAIKEGIYPRWAYIYLWRPLLGYILPVPVKRFFKR